LSENALVVDIGSNDGTLLREFQKLGFQVVGVEPSTSLAQKVNQLGIRTYNNFLIMDVVSSIVFEFGYVDLVTANNVFAHNNDLRGMAESVAALLKPEGIFVFEVSSALHTFKGMVFDYIYHEHLSYHSLISLIPFLSSYSLQIFDVELIGTKGGSYRIYAKKTSNKVGKTVRLTEAIGFERENGLGAVEFYRRMYEEVQKQKLFLREHLDSLPPNSTVVGYGASATVTTLVYELSLFEYLDYLVDDNNIRHGCYLPGTDIEVKSPSTLVSNPPTHVLILAWRFADLILDRIKYNLPDSVEYIIPFPSLNISIGKGLE
jgi:SAM-dependent methyltransferase